MLHCSKARHSIRDHKSVIYLPEQINGWMIMRRIHEAEQIDCNTFFYFSYTGEPLQRILKKLRITDGQVNDYSTQLSFNPLLINQKNFK
jgi:hypothetical protein